MGLADGKGWAEGKKERGRKNNFTPGVSTSGKSMYYHNYLRYSYHERGAIHYRDEQASKQESKQNKQTNKQQNQFNHGSSSPPPSFSLLLLLLHSLQCPGCKRGGEEKNFQDRI